MRAVLPILFMFACAADPDPERHVVTDDTGAEPGPIPTAAEPPALPHLLAGSVRWGGGGAACPTMDHPYAIPAGAVYQLRWCDGGDCIDADPGNVIIRDRDTDGGGDVFLFSCDRGDVYVFTWIAPAE